MRRRKQRSLLLMSTGKVSSLGRDGCLELVGTLVKDRVVFLWWEEGEGVLMPE